MAITHWTRLTTLVADALALAPDDRAAFLDAHATGTLRAEAEALIAAHEKAEATDALRSPFAEEPSGDGLLGDELPSAALRMVGRDVGPWRITGHLGSGGMGAVYRAERADGLYDREVALKLLAPGAALVGGDWLARQLDAERRILARLEHAGIARLYDGGLTPDGLPYLALELVEGTPITEYAKAHALSTDARLALVMQAAEAVAYAHRRLVVHRDLKPSNLLVAEGANGAPSVKLLDFGISAILADDVDAGHPGLTVPGAMTPAYAAPEQLRREPVTTATDVYALGVLLYELLARRRPYDLSNLTAAEAERIVCETTPPPPSTHAPGLSPDLDRVVMKALAREPERRYASAEAFADDLRRFQDGLPVEARDATAGYVLRRFVRRHRASVAAAALVVLAVLGGAGVAVWQAQAARMAQAEAEAQAERAQAVSDFLGQILLSANPLDPTQLESTGPNAPISAVLAEAAARLERDLAHQPEARADLHHVIGDTYEVFGMYDEMRQQFDAMLVLRESLFTAPHPKLAEALYHAGKSEFYETASTPTDYVEGARLYERAAEMLRQRPGGVNYPFVLLRLSGLHFTAGLYDNAEALSEESYVYVRDHFTEGTDGYRYRASMMAQMAGFVAAYRFERGDMAGAEQWLRLAEETGADPELGRGCFMGEWEVAQGNRAAGERAYARCAELVEEYIAQGSTTGWQPGMLVAYYDEQGRPDLADPFRASAAEYTALVDSVGPILRAYFESRE